MGEIVEIETNDPPEILLSNFKDNDEITATIGQTTVVYVLVRDTDDDDLHTSWLIKGANPLGNSTQVPSSEEYTSTYSLNLMPEPSWVVPNQSLRFIARDSKGAQVEREWSLAIQEVN